MPVQQTAPTAGSRCSAAALAVLLGALAASGALAADLRQATGVVELFTSQSCSSCPPADRVLAELSGDPDTLALGWHVDYWDYLGWKDTFASPQATKRQRAYAASLGGRGVYTPQAVINGRVDVVGSRGISVTQALDEMKGTANGMLVDIGARVDGNVLKVEIPAAPHATGSTLWMVYFDNSRSVAVEAGENGGRKLDYSNIVRDMEMIGMVGDQPLKAEFPLTELGGRGYDSCALVLQKKTRDGMLGPIVGALLIRDLPR